MWPDYPKARLRWVASSHWWYNCSQQPLCSSSGERSPRCTSVLRRHAAWQGSRAGMKGCSLLPSISQNKSALWSVPEEKKVKLKRARYGTASRRFLPGMGGGGGLQRRTGQDSVAYEETQPSSTSEASLPPASDQ